jgi:hypothetical protein
MVFARWDRSPEKGNERPQRAGDRRRGGAAGADPIAAGEHEPPGPR